MRWDIFKPFRNISDPNSAGEYLGSINTSDKLENGINPEIMRLDLHLRKKGLKAYSENYGLVKNPTPYKGDLNK